MKIWVQEYGSIFKIVKNMGLCNMGSFLKIRKYGSKQYGFIQCFFSRGTFWSPWQFSHSELPRAIFGFHGHFFAKLPRSPKFAVIYFFRWQNFVPIFTRGKFDLWFATGDFLDFTGTFFIITTEFMQFCGDLFFLSRIANFDVAQCSSM